MLYFHVLEALFVVETDAFEVSMRFKFEPEGTDRELYNLPCKNHSEGRLRINVNSNSRFLQTCHYLLADKWSTVIMDQKAL